MTPEFKATFERCDMWAFEMSSCHTEMASNAQAGLNLSIEGLDYPSEHSHMPDAVWHAYSLNPLKLLPVAVTV